MQYKVPQNIDQEDKILGPLTFTQFVYVLVGGGVLLLLYSTLDTTAFLLLGIPLAILTALFALVKIQTQPFSHFFVSLLIYLKQPKHRLWQDLTRAEAAREETDKKHPVDQGALGDDFFADVRRDEPVVPPLATSPAPLPAMTQTIPAKPARKLQINVSKN